MRTIPLADLPEAEPLPLSLLGPGDEAWQRGIRLVDRDDGLGGRVTAGSWMSGAFATSAFTFGGHEWMYVLDGRIEIATPGGHWILGPGDAGVVPSGTRCTWTQPLPVMKVFLRWDGPSPDQSAPLWHSSEPGPGRSFSYLDHKAALFATRDSASWLSVAHVVEITLDGTAACIRSEPFRMHLAEPTG